MGAMAKNAHSYGPDRDTLLQRLRRIEGQARGISRMVEEGRYCVEILQQIASLQAAADSVAMLLLEDHLRGCVADGLRSGNEERVDEAIGVIRRYLKR
ncbi:MAG: metal-sensitive transcriptional regulator [Chloroflexota bacterium]|nr:metal-sensitive transcriptional regulator [Chloroflexota bacterium]